MIPVLEFPAARAQVRPISVEAYHKLAADNKRTELIQGVIFEKMSKSPLHANALYFLLEFLRGRIRKPYALISENPITLVDSEPEPDIAIVHPPRGLYDAHPTFAYLVVEISVTTIEYDMAKADVYAAGNIPAYWVILPEEKVTVAYTHPHNGSYSSQLRVPFAEKLKVILPENSFEICLADIFA